MRQLLLQDLREQTIIIIVNSIFLDYQTKKLSVKLKSPSALAHWRVLQSCNLQSSSQTLGKSKLEGGASLPHGLEGPPW